MTTSEFIPICDNCSMREIDAPEQDMVNAREAVIDIVYNEMVEFSDLSDKLEEKGFDPELASCAVDCLGKIQRRYCIKADRGWRDDSTFGVVPRGEGVN